MTKSSPSPINPRINSSCAMRASESVFPSHSSLNRQRHAPKWCPPDP